MNSASFIRTRDGIALAYEVVGEGKPVVLIHGFASSREQNWATTGWIDRLKVSGFRVASFDCRGHGLSDKPHDPATYGEYMVEDIAAVMDASNFGDAYLMGYSMGAMLAIRFLMQYPDRVRKAVVAGLGDNYFGEHDAWRQTIVDAMRTDDPSLIENDEARKFRIFGGQKGKDRVALAACMEAERHMYRREELKNAQRPVLVVAGENDTLTGPPYALAASFADGRALLLPNKDHMSAVGDPGYKRAVLDFFSD